MNIGEPSSQWGKLKSWAFAMTPFLCMFLKFLNDIVLYCVLVDALDFCKGYPPAIEHGHGKAPVFQREIINQMGDL